MKMFWKNEDRVIDNLLRANTKGRGGLNQACREFDPDLANAYIERSLTATERAGYEQHLSDCHSCRSSVVVLSRMVEAESAPAVAALSVREPSRFAAFKGLFTASAMPRVAAAALAVIVLAVSIPLLFSREDRERSDESAISDVAIEQKSKTDESRPASPELAQPNSRGFINTDPAQALPGDVAQAHAVSKVQEKTPSASGETALAKQTPAEPEGVVSGAGAGAARVEPPQTEKLDARSATESSNQPRKAESDTQLVAKEQTTPPPPAPAAETTGSLGRINTEDARRLRQQDKDAVSVTIKPGRGGMPGVEKGERSTIRPADAVAPPSSAGSGERRGLAEPSPRANRDEVNTGSAAFAPRGSPTRKVGGKKFWLSKDTWTDKDYNPNKEMPVVTIERDSDIYKELLTKRSGLKLYLMGFGEGERAIFVYKGTVYKLVPQNSR